MGVCMDRAVAELVAFVAVLKAGGCCVPLDPNAPPSRQALIVRDCGVRVLVTHSPKAEYLVAVADTLAGEGQRAGASPQSGPTTLLEHVALVDFGTTADQWLDSMPRLPLQTRLTPWKETLRAPITVENACSGVEDLAFILYTSGSTGTPKGVMTTHRSLAYISGLDRDFEVTGADLRFLVVPPVRHAFGLWAFALCVSHGGTLLLVPPGTESFPAAFASLVEHERVSAMAAIPTLLPPLTLFGDLSAHDLSALRTVIFGGDRIPPTHLRRWVSMLPHVRTVNLLGCTEASVNCSYSVDPKTVERLDVVPVGRSLDEQMELFVLTQQGERVTEPGEQGELYVSGPSLMRGYWGDAARTAAALVSHPLRPESGELALRSSTLASYDAEGNLIYHGRLDNVVKTRGYRVEPGEVEAVLFLHPAVKEAVVAAVPDEFAGHRLVAVIGLVPETQLALSEVRFHCSQRLPEYMVPQEVQIRSEGLPKTPTGKIDRVSIARELVPSPMPSSPR